MENKGSKIDTGASAATDLDAELRTAMQSIRPPREKSAPPSTANKPTSKRKTQTKKANAKKGKAPKLEQLKMDAEDNTEVDLKAQLNSREVKFLEYRFVEGMTIEDAMKSAGYENYSQRQLFRIASKIVTKYEQSAGDSRKIFREIGAGETAVAKGLLELATGAKSEMVRLNAWQAIAKCLGLHKEVVDVEHGINIIVTSAPPATAQEPQEGKVRPALIRLEAPKGPPKPLCITE